jgi:uncharacterized protein (TIGR01777 family)
VQEIKANSEFAYSFSTLFKRTRVRARARLIGGDLNNDKILHLQRRGSMKILITGSSGLVGSALISFLEKNKQDIYKLVRVRADLLTHEIAWDPQRGIMNPSRLEGLDAVVHLAGENIMGFWTEAKKKRIRDSRVKGTQLLCQALCQLQKLPSVLICASAVGYYGDRGNEILTEQSPRGEGFLAGVCEEWEEATRLAAEKGIRTLNLRFGMVLSSQGGALQQMLPIFKSGLGGQMGSGSQYVSWITIDDLVRIVDYALNRESLAGPLNAVTPYPVTNTELTKALGHVLHRPTLMSMPAFMVKLIFGELGKELLLSSARVEPKKLEDEGFQFEYPQLEEALRYLLNR